MTSSNNNFPICDICLVSPDLCEKCKSKIEKGEIKTIDVILSKEIHRLFRKGIIIDQPSFLGTIEINENEIIILTKDRSSKLIGKNSMVLKELSKNIDKKIYILNIKEGPKSAILDFIYPNRIFYLSKVYISNGKTINKVLIPKNVKKDLKKFEQILEIVFNEPFRVEYL